MGLPPYPEGGYVSLDVPPFPFSSTKQLSEIDLRKEMKDILALRGHWIVLRRMNQRQRCFCWNEQGVGDKALVNDNRKYDEPKLRCPVCNGEGWVYREEAYLSRRRLVAPEIGLAAQEMITPIGYMNVNYIIYYLEYYINPDKRDIILEVELNPDGTPVRPFVYKERYNIAVCEPFRDQGGRIEYWRLAAKLEIT